MTSTVIGWAAALLIAIVGAFASMKFRGWLRVAALGTAIAVALGIAWISWLVGTSV